MSDVADGVIWAAEGSIPHVPNNPNTARVTNMSLGAQATSCSNTMQEAINFAHDRGAVVAVAAGNSSECIRRCVKGQ